MLTHLFLADLADLEVDGLGMSEVEAADGRGRMHGQRLGELDVALGLGVKQAPHALLLRVVGLTRVAGRRPYALFTNVNIIIGFCSTDKILLTLLLCQV